MGRKRKYTAQFKAKVALEVAKGDKTTTLIASKYDIHPQVRAWEKEFFENPTNLSVLTGYRVKRVGEKHLSEPE